MKLPQGAENPSSQSAYDLGGETPRQVHVGLFVAGVAAFPASAFFIGQDTGDTLWRPVGAALLEDIVCVRLRPPRAG